MSFFAIGFIIFPVFQSWAGPPEPFVRWYPFNLDIELVWRGIFATYALLMLYTAFYGPTENNIGFVVYIGISGMFHSTVMLVMNLVEARNGNLNGNMEHLYGDIAGWYLVGLFSLIVCVASWKNMRLRVHDTQGLHD